MSHFHNLGHGYIPERTYRAARRIAAEHDSVLIRHDDPRWGNRYWFQCHNRGVPFDGETASAVADGVLAELGIAASSLGCCARCGDPFRDARSFRYVDGSGRSRAVCRGGCPGG